MGPKSVRLVTVVIRQIMTESVVTAGPDVAVREVATIMRDSNVGSVVIVDGSDRPTAIVTDRDLAVSALASGASPEEPVISHATKPLITGDPATDVEEAAALMVQNRIRRLPIVENLALVGIVTLDDLATRPGRLELDPRMTAEITRAVIPDFYFQQRG